jgi:hypothetical protein
MKMTKTIKTSAPKPAVPAGKRTAAAAPARKTGKSTKAAVPVAPPQPTGSKQAQLITLLKAPDGATIEQMTSATGWQAHTVRGAISGVLRKKLGLNVVCAGDAGSRAYRIVAA